MTAIAFETIDDSGQARGQCCLALDRNGNPSVAYAANDGGIHLASRSGNWSREAVTSAGRISPGFDRVCLDIDSQGNPHIAYREMQTAHLTYGVRHNSQWSIMEVPTRLGTHIPGGVLGYDLRVDTRGVTPQALNTPHFVFHDPSTNQLGYAKRIGNQFKLLVAAPEGIGQVGLCSSMAFDRDAGGFRIAYFDNLTGGAALLPRISTMLIISDTENVPASPPTRLDEGGYIVNRPTAAAGDGLSFCVVFDTFNSTTGALTDGALNVVFTAPGVSHPIRQKIASISQPVAVAVIGTPAMPYRIAFADTIQLKLASQDGLGNWTIETIANGGEMPSLAYHPQSRTGHIAYTANGMLRYGKWSESA